MRNNHFIIMTALLYWSANFSGCVQDPLTLTTIPDGAVIDQNKNTDDTIIVSDAQNEGNGDGSSEETTCVPQDEVCDEKDNDCNGTVDDVAIERLQQDPANCGACGKQCAIPNAISRCEAGACVLSSCAPGFHDLNSATTDTDGCEYQCLPTNGGKEECPTDKPNCACDKLDNDCDGEIDETFDLNTDPNNCGLCGRRCELYNAEATCSVGVCTVTTCKEGFHDLNGLDDDGCEYLCPAFPPKTVDDCDGVDSDCDGTIDEDFVSAPCGNDLGLCKKGTTECVNGQAICQGETLPVFESCNGLDDNCNDIIDDGFDKLNDPRYCENCKGCALTHAQAKCVSGTCKIAACDIGWIDADLDSTNGCEYACTATGPEICDGIDNDCDKKIDAQDSDMVKLSTNPCRSQGECVGTTASCHGSFGWVCDYKSTVDLLSCTNNAGCGGGECKAGKCQGIVAGEETRCDGKDNDCDTQTDDPFTNKGSICFEEGKFGICQGEGTFQCDGAQAKTICVITTGKAGKPPTNELCNGLDDDCDGKTDEEQNDAAGLGVVDDMIRIQRTVNSVNYDYYIYRYEASHPDATSSSSGVSTTRACGKAGVLPWNNVTYDVAESACAASGKRLCTAEEWVIACQGVSTTTFPYGNSYQPLFCNGVDLNKNAPAPTGSLAQCVGGSAGLFDMSGNLREWTNDPISTVNGKTIYVMRGGAYHTPELGLSCSFALSHAVEDVILPANGFRCCSDSAP